MWKTYIRLVHSETLYVEFIEGYAGVMMGMRSLALALKCLSLYTHLTVLILAPYLFRPHSHANRIIHNFPQCNRCGPLPYITKSVASLDLQVGKNRNSALTERNVSAAAQESGSGTIDTLGLLEWTKRFHQRTQIRCCTQLVLEETQSIQISFALFSTGLTLGPQSNHS